MAAAFSPWWDKHGSGGALDVRRLFMTKDGYRGTRIYYPSGSSTVQQPDGSIKQIPNQEIAMQIVETIRTGGVFALPSEVDANGTPRWKVEESQVSNNPSHILQYPKELDAEILNAMGIADDVLKSEATGSWAGKAVPQQATYCILEQWLSDLICDVDRVIEKLVEINFGHGHQYEITTRPLADQMLAQQNDPAPSGNAAPKGDPSHARSSGVPQPGEPLRMEADEAPGWLRMAWDPSQPRAPKGGLNIDGREFEGGWFIPKNDGNRQDLYVQQPIADDESGDDRPLEGWENLWGRQTKRNKSNTADDLLRQGARERSPDGSQHDFAAAVQNMDEARAFLQRESFSPEDTALILDAGQSTLNIAGLVDPTPTVDVGNSVLYAARGQFGNAGISLAGGLVPYAGDLAKAFKFPRYIKIVGRLAKAMAKDRKLAKVAAPILKKLLDSLTTASDAIQGGTSSLTKALPKGLLDNLDKLRHEVVEALKVVDEGPLPVNGRMPINWRYAGKTYFDELPDHLKSKYPNGVKFDNKGYPDFSPHAIHTVTIKYTGSRTGDFKAAYSQANLPTKKGYVWHHHQDVDANGMGRMELVPEDLHKAVKHTGGVASWQELFPGLGNY